MGGEQWRSGLGMVLVEQLVALLLMALTLAGLARLYLVLAENSELHRRHQQCDQRVTATLEQYRFAASAGPLMTADLELTVSDWALSGAGEWHHAPAGDGDLIELVVSGYYQEKSGEDHEIHHSLWRERLPTKPLALTASLPLAASWP